MSKRKSRVWTFFDELENDARKVKCNQCQAVISRGGQGRKANTTSMINHIKYKHSRLLPQLDSVVKNPPDDQFQSRYPRKIREEKAVDVKIEPFPVIDDVIDGQDSTNQANIQETEDNDPLRFSAQRFKGTTGNLSVHLKRYHDNALEKIREAAASNDDVVLESDDEADSLHGQDIYFEEIDDQVKCTVCGKIISDAGEDPREHLEEHHPALLAKIIKNEDRAEEEEEAQHEKDIFTEVVYLDQVSPPQIKKRQAQTKKPTTDNQKKRKLSTNSDEPLVKTKPSEIESFTNYIRVLLEKLPQDVCSRLQLEIIGLIMAAKLNLPSNTVSAHAPVTGTNCVQEGN